MSKRYTMTNDAVENYGEKWRGVVLTVTHTATKYMPAKEFYAKGKPTGYHPGYDEGMAPSRLYDLATEDGTDVPFSLYEWELKRA